MPWRFSQCSSEPTVALGLDVDGRSRSRPSSWQPLATVEIPAVPPAPAVRTAVRTMREPRGSAVLDPDATVLRTVRRDRSFSISICTRSRWVGSRSSARVRLSNVIFHFAIACLACRARSSSRLSNRGEVRPVTLASR
jgi:hypothetical protein